MDLQPALCSRCGASLEASAVFCPQCGNPRGPVAVAGDPLVGREVIGQYVIQRKLAEGGMGAVYLADQRSVGRQAVVKVMHPELSRDPSVAPRFELEARAASLLNHPHIVTIYNYGAMQDGTLFLAMEYCRGESLDALLSRGPVSWERAARIGLQICDALAEAHRRGIVHRDLKPSNIMLVETGRQHDFVKVLDFGIAKLEGSKVTRTGSIIGTPQYMSPEQFRGEKLDGRSDLYSLGVLLYEMVAGKPPFESPNTAGFMHKHLEEAPVPPSTRAPGLQIARGLEAIVLCALAKDAAERFADAEEMARALEGALSQPEQIPRTRLMQASRTRRRGLLLSLAGGAVLAAGAATATVLIFRRPAAPAPSAGSGSAPIWLQPIPSGGSSAATAQGSGSGLAGVRLASAPDASPRPALALRPAIEPKRRGRAEPRGKRAASASKLPSEGPVETGSSGALGGDAPPAATPPPSPPPPAPQPAAGGGKASNDLLAELKRWMGSARVPPSEWDSTLAAYRQTEAAWPATERDSKRREYLGQLIALYRKPTMQLSASERLPLARLRQIFLTMTTRAPLTPDERTRILEATLATYDRGNRPEKDRVYFKRMAVLQLIKSYAADPGQAIK